MNRRVFCLSVLALPVVREPSAERCHLCGQSFPRGYDHEKRYTYTRVFPLHGHHYCSEHCRIIGGYLDGWYGTKTMRVKLRFLV